MSLAKAAGDVEDKRHCQVGGIIGEHPRGVRNHDAFRLRRGQIDMIDARAIAGDEFEPWRGGSDDVCIDTVGNRWHQHIAIGHRSDQCVPAEWSVVGIEFGVK